MKVEELHQLFLNAKGISTDTRKLEKGTIFFALKGDNFNGNEFAESALKKGGDYAIVDEAKYVLNEKCILVDSVLKTLQNLANYHRKQFDIPLLGITGSNGKTTTKELIGVVLSKKYKTLVTEGNLNNHLGVPLTLLRLSSDHEFAVIEMGANKVGDIKELTEIAEPTLGIITNIGAAHLEGFGSFENVIKTKTELYQFIDQTNGILFFNADDKLLVNEMPKVNSYSYGEQLGEVKGRLKDLTPYVHFSWSTKDSVSATIRTHLVGRYNVSNFLAAVAIGTFFKVPSVDIDSALQEYKPSDKRSEIQKTDRNTLIVDCYNANVSSMNAALQSFLEMKVENKLAILGDMLELGSISMREHQKTVNYLVANNLRAILIGSEFCKTDTLYPTYNSYKELIQKGNIIDLTSSWILLKGSRAMQLEKLVPLL